MQAFDQVFKIRTVQPAAGTMRKINSVNLCHRLFVCLYTFISCYLKEIIKIGFLELEKNILKRFRSFFVK